MRPRVYVIIVNYNGYADTIECLDSVLMLDYPNIGVIVVDNSSTPQDIHELLHWTKQKKIEVNILEERRLFDTEIDTKKITFLKAESNRGFAAANNLGIRAIEHYSYDYVWLLNNDTVVEKNALSALVEDATDTNEKVGIWGAKLKLYYAPSRIQGVGGRYNKWFGKVNEIGFGEDDLGQWDFKYFPFDYVIGASMFVKRDFITDVGLMDEDYFLYYEELDWAIRGKNKKWKLGFSSRCVVYHKMGKSINKNVNKGNSLLADYYSVRNRILLSRKYFPYTQIVLYPSFIKFVYNRIRLKQTKRIKLLLTLMLNPRLHLNTKPND